MVYPAVMGTIRWRMPVPGEPSAKLLDGLNVADAAEAMEQPDHLQLRQGLSELRLVVFGPTAAGQAIKVLLWTVDSPFVGRLQAAAAMDAEDIEMWTGR